MEGVAALLAGCPAAGLAGGLGVTVCAAAAGGVLLYKIARRKKPTHTTVNCWFCNQDTVVPYGNHNCWDCPNCEQYNGFQENGDYNKPIPAQYMEHLNHVVTGAGAYCDPSVPQQWGKYDEEIEVYRHHVEQTYKLCRPCQAAVEYYIKHQNRQLRALLLRHHFSHRKTDKTYMQSFYAAALASTTTPIPVIALRFLAFLSCAILVAMALYGAGNPFSPELTTPPPPRPVPVRNGTAPTPPAAAATPGNGSVLEILGWQELVQLLPEQVLETLRAAWTYGKNHQMAVVLLGLLTCFLAMLLAGRIRLRRIDAFASFLWLLVMSFHLAESYLQTDAPSWLDTAKFGTTSLCCLVGFAAAVATRKPMGQRRPRPRRYLSGDSVAAVPNGTEIGFPYLPASPSMFIPTPPSILQLSQQCFRSPRRMSSSSLPGQLNRALSLGTIPSLARADSGYLFSGSRPPSQTSHSKESEYFSLLSGSGIPSRVPSPAPSVAGSVASSSSSLRYRRPLISPARLNLAGRRLMLFPSQREAPPVEDHTHSESIVFASDLPVFSKRNPSERGMPDMRAVIEAGSICSDHSLKKRDNSSHSSSCVVDTTTKGEEPTGWRGRFGNSSIHSLLAVSLAVNAIFTSAYLYQSLR
ncbi:transmembrane protein 201 isoform X2 [Hemicordylus capensis]|uniref:transmembrane protein 201 isoform X2 n=1 Tax=Hemicordylus capensis TaxID=884348 RepID=UPI0023032118|nr:transmembrane protein 201 isoform X2 [Hemicordylus capensis]